MIMFQKVFLLLAALALGLSINTRAVAQNAALDIIPASSLSDESAQSAAVASGSTTHPALKMTPDKSELIRLEREAGSVIIGNPEHVSVLSENAKTLIFVPKLPGATHITVLDKKGEVVMARHIIVASPQKKYVRIRRSCANSDDESCRATQVYYCPDMCHPIQVATEAAESDDSPFDALEALVEGSGQDSGLNDEITEE